MSAILDITTKNRPRRPKNIFLAGRISQTMLNFVASGLLDWLLILKMWRERQPWLSCYFDVNWFDVCGGLVTYLGLQSLEKQGFFEVKYRFRQKKSETLGDVWQKSSSKSTSRSATVYFGLRWRNFLDFAVSNHVTNHCGLSLIFPFCASPKFHTTNFEPILDTQFALKETYNLLEYKIFPSICFVRFDSW